MQTGKKQVRHEKKSRMAMVDSHIFTMPVTQFSIISIKGDDGQ